MRQIILVTAFLCAPMMPATAQETPNDKDGFELMEEGARMLLRGLITEVEPALDEMRDAFDEMGPAFAEFATTIGPAFQSLLAQVDDIRHYDAPEILPNGDIIMRRSLDAPEWVMPDEDDTEIEL